MVVAALWNPYWLLRGGAFLVRKLWSIRRELARCERIGKITFFVHNFMDSAHLDPERIRNCSFMVMTGEGPVSMCEVNARRDNFILSPISLPGPSATRRHFDPLTGRIEEERPRVQLVEPGR